MTRQPDIFNDLLDCLGVPHTYSYSYGRFSTMPFPSLFGLEKLLGEYGVDTVAFQVADKSVDIDKVARPFIAPTSGGMVIVTDVDADTVSYLSQGQSEKMAREGWIKAWDGVALCASSSPASREPDYAAHRRVEMIRSASRAGLWIGLAVLFLYMFIGNGLWHRVSTWFLAAFDLAGLYFTWLLVRKSIGYKDAHAEAVCGVLQKGGCDEILSTDASKLFGVFGWAEIGFSYFSVSLLAMLMFPGCLPELALFNLCCLPYTCWSIWYQRFRAHHWCTLCVSVQCTLWCLFFSYLAGGWVVAITADFSIITAAVLGVTYLTTLLALNRLLPALKHHES